MRPDQLIALGWTPPPKQWLSPSTAEQGRVYLTWCVEANEPFENGIAEFHYKWGDSWYSIDGQEIDASEIKGIFRVPGQNDLHTRDNDGRMIIL